MTLHTREDEHINKIKYVEYNSPNADFPEQGILAVSAVRRLSKYILNGVLENLIPSLSLLHRLSQFLH